MVSTLPSGRVTQDGTSVPRPCREAAPTCARGDRTRSTPARRSGARRRACRPLRQASVRQKAVPAAVRVPGGQRSDLGQRQRRRIEQPTVESRDSVLGGKEQHFACRQDRLVDRDQRKVERLPPRSVDSGILCDARRQNERSSQCACDQNAAQPTCGQVRRVHMESPSNDSGTPLSLRKRDDLTACCGMEDWPPARAFRRARMNVSTPAQALSRHWQFNTRIRGLCLSQICGGYVASCTRSCS
jgi:hypothetical protein